MDKAMLYNQKLCPYLAAGTQLEYTELVNRVM